MTLRRLAPYLALAMLSLSACVVHEREVVRGPPRCAGGVWVDGHYGPHGRWHPGHWRCPGVVEEEFVVRP